MRGTSLAAQVARVRPALRTLLVTALVDARTRDEARALGVVVLTKPIDVEALLAAVRTHAVLDAGEAAEDPHEEEAPPLVPRDAAVGGGLGLVLGVLTTAGAWELYPPTPHHIWPLGLLVGISLTVVLVLYLMSLRFGPRVGDWIVLGYTAAVLVAASLVVGRETIGFLQDHVPWGSV